MLHVTGGGSMKLHGLKKDHVHWTTAAGAAGAAASPPQRPLLLMHPPPEADAITPNVPASTNGDGDRFLLVGSFLPLALSFFTGSPPPLARI